MFSNVGFNEGNDEAIRMTTRPIIGRESEKIFSFETEMSVKSELYIPSSNEMGSNWSSSNDAGKLNHSQENLPFPNRVDQDTKFDEDRCELNMSILDAEAAMPHSRAQALRILNCIEKRENNSKRLPLRDATLGSTVGQVRLQCVEHPIIGKLRKAVQMWTGSEAQEHLRQRIVWKLSISTNSFSFGRNLGEAEERQIRTFRERLSNLVKQQRLNDESLSTLVCIVEDVINNLPLTVVSVDPNDLEPLTPNHLLQFRAGPTGPPGVFVRQDVYCRRRWRQVLYMADMYWKGLTKEYLPTLQRRGKWLQEKRNVQTGDRHSARGWR